jgi:hypothetical protein
LVLLPLLPLLSPQSLLLPSSLLPFCCLLFLLPTQPALQMIKIESRQEKTIREEPYIGPNVPTPGGSTG